MPSSIDDFRDAMSVRVKEMHSLSKRRQGLGLSRAGRSHRDTYRSPFSTASNIVNVRSDWRDMFGHAVTEAETDG